MKRAYKQINLRDDRLAMVEQCNTVISRYQRQGLTLTLRQLYYQLVTQNIIANKERSYKNLGNLVSDARLGGLIDWDAIEDRVRVPRSSSQWNNIAGLVESALDSFRLPRWKGQDSYVELWVEKDAISGVLSPIADEYHVTLMVNRGYSSQSAMHEAALRFRTEERREAGHVKQLKLLYLGDHDPSGEDMVRDIQERLLMFGANVVVEKIALTMDQVEEYNPPPNPAKLTDTRSNAYIEKHGDESWEVDALPPDVLHQLIEDAILGYLDLEKMDKIKEQEEEDKIALTKFAEDLGQ